MDKEREIYIKDMLFCILRKWRVILVWMVIFAVALDGVAVAKSYKTMVESRNAQNSAVSEVETAKMGLSESDIKKAEDTYELYLTYKKSLDDSLYYYSHSIKMQLDPNDVATISLQYSVNNPKMLKDIINAYSNTVLSEETCQYINDKVGLESKTGYINELITFSFDEDKNNTTVIEDVDSKSMLINILAQDKKSCEGIADIVEEKIREQTPQIQKNLGDFQIEKVARNYVAKANSKLLAEQQNFMSNLNAIKSSISNLNTSLTDEQKSYYSALVDQKEEVLEEQKVNTDISFQMVNLKYIILGLFAGAFLAMVWYMVRYIIGENLRVDNEVETFYGVSIIGTIDSGKKTNTNLIDRLIYQIFHKNSDQSREEAIQLISSNVLWTARKQGINSVHITGIADSEYVDNVKKQLVEKIQKEAKTLKCSMGQSIFHDVYSLNALADSESVIFVEEVGQSNFAEIGKEIDMCLKNNVKVIGAVVIK